MSSEKQKTKEASVEVLGEDSVKIHGDAAEVAPLPTELPKKRRFRLRLSRSGWILAGVILVNVALLAGTVYLRLQKPKVTATQTVTPAPTLDTSSDAMGTENKVEAPKLLHYKAEKLGAEFDYPVDWRVQDNGEGVLLSSPLFTLRGATGATEQGRLVLGIHKTYQGAYVIYDETVAKAPAQELQYLNPAPGQVTRTYASFFEYGSSKNNSFDVVVIGGAFNGCATKIIRQQVLLLSCMLRAH
jgi:hypothetical protein